MKRRGSNFVTSFLSIACSLVLATSMVPAVALAQVAHVAEAAEADSSNDYFSADGLDYHVTGTGQVQLLDVPSSYSATSLTIPGTVANNGTSYQVTDVSYVAFHSNSTITSITMPDNLNLQISATGKIAECYEKLASITLAASGETPVLRVENGILYSGDTLMLVPRTLSINSLTVGSEVAAIAPYACYKNTSLQSLAVNTSLSGTALSPAAIGKYAFAGCTKLSSVKFASGTTLSYYTASGILGASVGEYAFKDCTALAEVVLPAILSSERKASYWQDYGGTNFASQDVAIGATTDVFISGYQGYWHNNNGPVYRAGVGGGAFSGCSSLASVVFKAGCDRGMFAYYTGASAVFYKCTSLKTVVFEDRQAYFSDPSGATQNGSGPENYWIETDPEATRIDSCDLAAEPSVYYAVNYYLTQSSAAKNDVTASSRDSFAKQRLARVEFTSGTSIAAICENDTATLSAKTPSSSLYADSGYADGQLSSLDPNAVAAANASTVAAANNMSASAVASTKWCWKLSYGQQAHKGLSDSCYAYLAPVSDISSGRIDSQNIANQYEKLPRVLTDDGEFDPVRYWLDSTYIEPFYSSGEENCRFVINSSGIDLGDFTLRDAYGNKVAYTISYERCTNATKTGGATLEKVATPTASGLYRITLTSTTSGYTGTLQQWILVTAHASGTTLYNHTGGTDATYTVNATTYAASASANTNPIEYSASYSIGVVEGDTSSGIIAAGIAGLGCAKVNIAQATSSAKDGFVITYGSKSTSYPTDGDAPAEMAVFSYTTFNKNRSTYGLSGSSYSWGDTAVVLSPNDVYDSAAVANYAYTQKAAVFYTSAEGELSSDTLSCLNDFTKVLVVGDENLVSAAVYAQLESAFGAGNVTRAEASAGDACGLSIALAKAQRATGATTSVASICNGTDPMDTIAALGYSGYYGGLSLVSTSSADSKRVLAYLHEIRDGVDDVRIYGRSTTAMSSTAFNAVDSWKSMLWSEQADVDSATQITEGDTVVLYGTEFVVGSGNTLTMTGNKYAVNEFAESGTVELAGKSYSYTTHVHQLKATKAKAATYTKKGNIAYWHCSVCGKYFSDADATKVVNKSSTTIAKLKAGSVKKVTRKGSKATVTLKAGQRAKQYVVYYRQVGTKAWKTAKTKKTSVAVKGLKKGKKYEFCVVTKGTSSAGKAITSGKSKKVKA